MRDVGVITDPIVVELQKGVVSEGPTYPKLTPQSGREAVGSSNTAESMIMKVSGDQLQQNVKFSDQIQPYQTEIESVIDPTRKMQDSGDATLQNFFSRPIKISETEWTTSTTLAADFDPWDLYFGNPRVQNRLSNFNLMRAKLHLKFVINGNGFQYGRALAYYQPFNTFDDFATHSALISEDLVQGSQLPRVFLDPTTSQGGEMVLPYFNYLNYCNVPSEQWNELGQIYLRSLNTLKHANGASDLVTVSVFAWAEDVEMSVLTSNDINTLTPQSGTEQIEANDRGIVSGPATTIAKYAGYLTEVPTIGPFAKATQMTANATASVAKLFGYSRPPVTKNPDPYKPTVGSSMATTVVPDGPQKLTVDDQQELTIDPRVAGLGSGDPMSIKGIASRESYLTTFPWAIGTSPETLLWNARVDPCTWAQNAGPPTSYHFPACAMAALPFKYWTGTMKFRFQIVCSAFHKGRLKISYDPNFLATNEYNTNYTTIVDIADKTDFTIEIANGQDRTLLEHSLPGINSVTQMYSTTVYASNEPWGNGVVGVHVVNELTTPNSTVNNDIEINVFVSMGDDFEVFVPDDFLANFVFKPQSGTELISESQNTEEPSAPQQGLSEKLGPVGEDSPLLNSVFTGESIASFRPLLKRYNYWWCLAGLGDGTATLTGTLDAFPFLRGNVSTAIMFRNGGATPYNYVNTILLHWITYAFAGWRGGIRYKWVPRGGSGNKVRTNFYVQRRAQGDLRQDISTSFPTGFTNLSNAGESALPNAATQQFNSEGPGIGINGTGYTFGPLNEMIEFEVPYYDYRRFSPGREERLSGITLKNSGFDFYSSYDAPSSYVFDIHVAAAEDFQVYFFTGLPRMYYESSPPAL